MKIEKKKIAEDSKWNSAVKASVAALMGVAASSMVACSTSGTVSGPEDENNRENVTPNPEEIIEPEAGDPIVGPEQLGDSSSSQVVVDIPKSSSSVDKRLLSSSSLGLLQESAGIIIPVEEPITTIVVVPASSSSEKVDSSSSEELNSSSSEACPDGYKLNCPCDSTVQICPDPNDPENMIVSMVTTFESTDIDV